VTFGYYTINMPKMMSFFTFSISFILTNAQLVVPNVGFHGLESDASLAVDAVQTDLKTSGQRHVGLRHILHRSKHGNSFQKLDYSPRDAILSSLLRPEHPLFLPIKSQIKNAAVWNDEDKRRWALGQPPLTETVQMRDIHVPDDRDSVYIPQSHD
jgi:hypothetical protein